jgi:hypothetical protein
MTLLDVLTLVIGLFSIFGIGLASRILLVLSRKRDELYREKYLEFLKHKQRVLYELEQEEDHHE